MLKIRRWFIGYLSMWYICILLDGDYYFLKCGRGLIMFDGLIWFVNVIKLIRGKKWVIMFCFLIGNYFFVNKVDIFD